ncbi:hypothetical protein MBORA_10340 [Methanobrevibacter oralis]|uniref:Uncharacterized protein n=1 Tax=Methanobrevibacter oralis TaxID=66851 RepID=A0A166B4N9_METOA|nr:hypothetical protein [Methanobrevibacter oralis]KZX12856.1 hypothetical protein MBORA_10340 [Methanobrevibacter oralis]
MKKFTIIDYIIIIIVIGAILFAFIHITSDDTSNIQKTAYDISTMNKISENYLKYYENGNIIKTTITGHNASTGEEVNLNGTIKWIGDNGGSDVSIIVEANNHSYLAGLYKNIPNADIYINTITLESNGEVYKNLTEFTIKPKEISSLKDLTSGISNNTDYEITTNIVSESIDNIEIQKIINKQNNHGKRLGIKYSKNLNNQLILEKANNQNIIDGDSVLGNFNGTTDDIKIRIYNCSDYQLNSIKNNYDVINIRNF